MKTNDGTTKEGKSSAKSLVEIYNKKYLLDVCHTMDAMQQHIHNICCVVWMKKKKIYNKK